MKRILSILFLLVNFITGGKATAQVVFTAPQSQQGQIFSSQATPTTSGCLANQGQNIWFSNYIVNSGGPPTTIQYRLEYSFNSDAATCTTGTWFAMSDDATDTTQGAVIGLGTYPFVRANLVNFGGNLATLNAYYSTASASPSNLYGFYNPTQQIRKVILMAQPSSSNSSATITVPTPYGSSAGYLLIVNHGATFASAGFTTTLNFGTGSSSGTTFSLSGSNNFYLIPLAPSAAVSVGVNYTHGTTAAGATFDLFLLYAPPGSIPPGAQPAVAQNSEATAVASTAAVALSPNNTQSGYFFSVSARCSAGTAGLSIVDGATTIWSTGPAEVGTTTFRFQWNPGLNASLTSGDGVEAKLTSCGASNTGTIDVQGSVF